MLMKKISILLISLFLFNVVIIVSAESAEVTNADLNITVLYDNYIFKEGLKADWGFACLVEGLDKTILFDVGTHGSILLNNAKKLGVNLKNVDVLAISHDHRDHYGGMDDFLKYNNNVDVYLLEAFSNQRSQTVKRHGASAISVQEPMQICKGAWLTGELGSRIKEQALVLDTKEGLVVITGCSHPGVVSMVKKAHEIIPKKNIHMVFGGFHMPRASQEEIKDTIKAFRNLGVQYAGPSHCSGDRTIAMFRQAYGENFIKLGVGKRISVATSDTYTSMYFGQKLPGPKPKLFKPDIDCLKEYKVAGFFFSPNGKRFYFRSSDNHYYMDLENGFWSEPKRLDFLDKYSKGLSRYRKCQGLCLSPDGQILSFMSNGDLWMCKRNGDSWSAPEKTPEQINSEKYECRLSICSDRSVYYTSQREGTKGQCDVFYSKYKDGRYQPPINIDAINTKGSECGLYVSPNEDFIIFTGFNRKDGYGGSDSYISFHLADGTWSKPKNMGQDFNSKGGDGPIGLSPDGKYFFFHKSRKTESDEYHSYIYWVSTKAIEKFRPK
jgi:7,8-dihydropterin-6-yl-methyl-4-(beta-D-ribofuranosyl)aminobenzene 5'-phosphate synthase